MGEIINALALFLCLGVAGACQAADAPSLPKFECDRSPLLIRDVDLWSPEGIGKHRDVLVVDGLIARIAPHGRLGAPKGARVLDGRRQLMLPGFVDAHVHFVFPGPLINDKGNQRDAVADALTFGRQLLASGVTSARVHLDTLEHARLLQDLARDECAPMPRLQVAGPAFIPGTGNNENAAVWDVTGVDDAIAKVQREHAQGFQWIALHDAQKFPDDARAALLNTARQLGMRILASGYTQPEVAAALALRPDTIDYLDVSPEPEYAAGLLDPASAQKQLTWVARIGIHDRYRAYQENPALIDAAANYEFFDASTAESLRLAVRKAIADRTSEHSKRMDSAYPTMRRKFEQIRRSGVPLAMGTDAGSVGQFHRNAIWWEIESWMRNGASVNEWLSAVAVNGARVLGDSSIDSLAAGKRADFLLYSGDLDKPGQAGVTAVARMGVLLK
jgi:imidazolonepropionase-like amidohydrolase